MTAAPHKPAAPCFPALEFLQGCEESPPVSKMRSATGGYTTVEGTDLERFIHYARAIPPGDRIAPSGARTWQRGRGSGQKSCGRYHVRVLQVPRRSWRGCGDPHRRTNSKNIYCAGPASPGELTRSTPTGAERENLRAPARYKAIRGELVRDGPMYRYLSEMAAEGHQRSEATPKQGRPRRDQEPRAGVYTWMYKQRSPRIRPVEAF